MSKRTVFTTVTPLPAGISRFTVMDTLRSHVEMIDLNPLVEERHPIKAPPHATPEEYHCLWYSLTDRVQYLPGGITYSACFHDLENGLQTHCYAPMGLNIKGKWTLGGSLPGEPVAPVELGLGAPLQGLYLREDVDFKCSLFMTSFVKNTIKKAHSRLVDRLVIKAQILEAAEKNQEIENIILYGGPFSSSQASTEYSPSEYGPEDSFQKGPAFTFPPPQKPTSAFGPEYTRSSDNTSDSSMYPRHLRINSSSASVHSSGSQREVQESLDLVASNQGPVREPVPWQNLKPHTRSPLMHKVEPAPTYYQSLNPKSAPNSRTPSRNSEQAPTFYQSLNPNRAQGPYCPTELYPQVRQSLKPMTNNARRENLPAELE